MADVLQGSAPGPAEAADASAFVAFLGRVHPVMEKAIRDRMPKPYEASATADLERYLYEPLRRFTFAGGKRIRPALCLLGAEALGASAEVALPVACAVELFQAAALIHDDIADQGELRRGQPCLHLTEGEGLAINAGDTGIVDVAAQVLQEDALLPDVRLQLFDELYAMERRTLEGQALDLGWVRDGRWDLAETDYLTMATLKTAHYSAASPLVMGALCATDANDAASGEELLEDLRAFGLACGLAFQIQDDLLNLVGDAEAQGKDFRSDITEGKRTLVMVRALRQLGEDDAHELRQILSAHATDAAMLARAVELADAAGALAYAHDYAQRLVREAEERIRNAQITSEARQTLLSMAHYFVNRAS